MTTAGTLETAEAAFALFREGLAGNDASLHQFVDMMADDVVLHFPPTPNTRPPYIGRETVREFFVNVVRKAFPSGLHITPRLTLTDGRHVAFQFADEATRPSGEPYRNSVTITFEIRDGKIATYWEYFGGPGYFEESQAG